VPLEPAPNGGGFSEAQPALAPQDSRQFLDQMLLGRSSRFVLCDERGQQNPQRFLPWTPPFHARLQMVGLYIPPTFFHC
jgi:hypothetical protein